MKDRAKDLKTQNEGKNTLEKERLLLYAFGYPVVSVIFIFSRDWPVESNRSSIMVDHNKRRDHSDSLLERDLEFAWAWY